MAFVDVQLKPKPLSNLIFNNELNTLKKLAKYSQDKIHLKHISHGRYKIKFIYPILNNLEHKQASQLLKWRRMSTPTYHLTQLWGRHVVFAKLPGL